MLNIKEKITNLKDFISSFNTLIKLNHLIRSNELSLKFIFFSEKKTYQKFSKILIEVLSKQYPNQIFYFSLDKNDIIESNSVKNYYIHNKYLAKFFFDTIKGENLFLTLTDLDNHDFKKTNNIKNYIYYFHSPVSTIKNYTPKAFDNYDIIFCNGKFHVEEIRHRENLKKLKSKKLVNTGYFYFDYLNENLKYDAIAEKVLIAPSWNYAETNFINENFIELIDILLEKGEKVIFRPHPEHFKRSKSVLNKIQKKFKSSNFKFDDQSDNFYSMQESKCLITDSSGIALEYIIVLKRPVLYLNDKDKIHNIDINDYSIIKIIDNELKKKFGKQFKINDFQQIDIIIDQSIKNIKNKSSEIDTFINQNFFNYGETKKFLSENSDNIF